jgi:hypothetical protein
LTTKKFFDKPIFGIIMIIFAILVIASAVEWYSYLFALIGFASGGHNLYKYFKNRSFTSSRPICNNCGYVALNERELHNHQINCERKIN